MLVIKGISLYNNSREDFHDREHFFLAVHIFRGKGIVTAEDIREKDSRVNGVLGRVRKRFLFQKYRDSIRRTALGATFVVVALEHQDKVHYAMPVRVMLEDAAGYGEQLQRIQKRHRSQRDLDGAEFLGGFAKTDRIDPVVTLVLYYGKEPWDGPKDLHQMMDYDKLPEEVKKYVNNYPIHVLDVRNYPDPRCWKR